MRVKELIHKQKDKDFELDLSFTQWLDNHSKPTSKELDVMEKELKIKSVKNNPYYQPLQGA